jgi:hypothetical protein
MQRTGLGHGDGGLWSNGGVSMKCPDCRRQRGPFSTSPDKFRPNAELACPHCGVGLRVGWWPVVGIGLLAAVGIAVGAWGGFWGGDWVIRELGVQDRRVLRSLVRVALTTSLLAALFGSGMYALWVFGWYARRPPIAGQGRVEPGAAHDPRGPADR